MIGNHVDGEYRHGGSNPPLSARKNPDFDKKESGFFACVNVFAIYDIVNEMRDCREKFHLFLFPID